MSKESLKYHLRNLPALFRSAPTYAGAKAGALCGALSILGTLSAKVTRYYKYVEGYGLKFNAAEDYAFLSCRKVTQAGVVYLVADWVGGASDIQAFKYIGCGTGTNAESNADTALQTECTTALSPASTRATATMTAQSGGVCNNVVQAVGTLTFGSSAAVTEAGQFSQSATGGGTLWDRFVFSAINVAPSDSIQFTIQITCAYQP